MRHLRNTKQEAQLDAEGEGAEEKKKRKKKKKKKKKKKEKKKMKGLRCTICGLRIKKLG